MSVIFLAQNIPSFNITISESVTLTYRSNPGMGIVLNKISDKYLYLYQILFKLIKGFRSYEI